MAGDPEPAVDRRVYPLSWRGQPVQVTAWARERGPETVLFVHGLGCSKRSFRAAFHAEALAHHTLLALDLVGFGESSRSAEFGYDLIDQGQICAQVIEGRGDRPIHLVGHSLGGTVACLLNPSVLERLSSLTLVEGRLLEASCGYSRLVSRLEEREFVQRHYPSWCKRMAHDAQLGDDLREADPVAVYRSACSLYRRVRAGDLPARLAACTGPRKVFLYGDSNRSLGEIDAVPGMRAFGIPRAGHFPMQDNPAAFYGKLAEVVTGA